MQSLSRYYGTDHGVPASIVMFLQMVWKSRIVHDIAPSSLTTSARSSSLTDRLTSCIASRL